MIPSEGEQWGRDEIYPELCILSALFSGMLFITNSKRSETELCSAEVVVSPPKNVRWLLKKWFLYNQTMNNNYVPGNIIPCANKNNKVLLYTAQSVFNLEFPAIPQLRQFRRCTQLQLMANLGDRKNARYPQLASGKLTIWPCQIGFGRLASIKNWLFSGSVYLPGGIYIYIYIFTIIY